MSPDFLFLDEVLALHAQQILLHGGSAGIRDAGLLQSALAMPSQSFGGAFVHGDVFEMAAAYLFHICKNHPFIDGNKRTALASSLVFLELNGVPIVATEDELVDLTDGVAAGRISKAGAAVFFSDHHRK